MRSDTKAHKLVPGVAGADPPEVALYLLSTSTLTEYYLNFATFAVFSRFTHCFLGLIRKYDAILEGWAYD